MTEPSARSLLAPLHHATEAGAVEWAKDGSRDYVLPIGENTVSLSVNSASALKKGYTFIVRDKDNRTIEWIGAYATTDEDYTAIARLYELVDRRTRNVDGVLSDILHRLEAVTGTSG